MTYIDILSSNISLSNGDFRHTFQLRDFNIVSYFRGTGKHSLNKIRKISDTELSLDGSSLVSDPEVIDLILYAANKQDGSQYRLFSYMASIREANVFIKDSSDNLDPPPKTPAQKGLENVIYFNKVGIPMSDSITINDIEGGITVSFYRRDLLGDSVDIISPGLDKNRFIEILGDIGLSLVRMENYPNTEIFQLFSGGERWVYADNNFILRLFLDEMHEIYKRDIRKN